jgi:exopolysaccharide biosynthesis polyprenyl glycosylphosphotransferase
VSDARLRAQRQLHHAVLDAVADEPEVRRLAGINGGAASIAVGTVAVGLPTPIAERSAMNGTSVTSAAIADAIVVPPRAVVPSGRLPSLRDATFRRLLALADVGAAAGGLSVIGAITGRGVALASLLSVPLVVLLAKLGGRYDHDDVVLRKSTLDEAPQLLVLAAAFALAWSAVAFVAGVRMDLKGAGVVALWAVTSALLLLLRTSARALADTAAPPERALVIGSSAARAQLAHSLACDPAAHVDVVAFLPLEDERRHDEEWGDRSRRKRRLGFDDLERIVDELGVDRVFLIPSGADSDKMLEAVRRATRMGVKVSIVPRLFEVVGSSVEFDTVGGVTVLSLRRQGLSASSRLIKRTVDIAISAIALVALAPLGVLVALAIKLDSVGPVFFRQTRVGRDGRRFEMLKFRSMVDGADGQRAALVSLNETAGLFKLSKDPRVTRVGRLLRRTSLDELPQLIHVLRGEMSLVGPRPLIPDEDRLVEGRHRDRLCLIPGMTGLWQVLGPPRPPLSEMVKTDYLYATNWSLWNDSKILLRTLTHVAARRGL